MEKEKSQSENDRSPLDPASWTQSNAPKKDTVQNTLSNHWPSDEQPQLASQVEDMASLLQIESSSPALSEKLHRFAKDVATLEERVSKYQAVIQRQQVQLQRISEANNSAVTAQLREELRSLKEENETLHSFVTANAHSQRQEVQPVQRGGEAEPGWVTVGHSQENNAETKSMMLYPDNPLMKRIDELQKINAKLFKANKDWHTMWEQLRQSKQDEKEELASRLNLAEEDNQKLKSDIIALENKAKAEKEKKEEKDKGESSKLKEKDAEIGLLKQQLTVFMQDFEREKKDRKVFQEKLVRKEKEYEKLKAENDHRGKSFMAEIRLKEDKLKANKVEINRLQYRVAELMDEVKREKRRGKTAAATPYVAQQTEAPLPTSMASLMYPSGAGAPLSTLYSSQFGIGHRQGPEEMPGAWTCPDCTYINYPDRTVCDICGLTKSFDSLVGFNEIGELQSRGPSPFSQGVNVPDNLNEVEVDSA